MLHLPASFPLVVMIAYIPAQPLPPCDVPPFPNPQTFLSHSFFHQIDSRNLQSTSFSIFYWFHRLKSAKTPSYGRIIKETKGFIRLRFGFKSSSFRSHQRIHNTNSTLLILFHIVFFWRTAETVFKSFSHLVPLSTLSSLIWNSFLLKPLIAFKHFRI